MSKSYRYEPRSGTVSAVEDAYSEIESLGEEMRAAVDNMSGTNLESTSKYETTSEAADALEGITQPSVPEAVAELAINYSEAVNRRKNRGTSRAVRLSNASGVLEAAKEACENWLADSANAEHDDRGDVEEFVNDLDSMISDCESVEFPGMYG